jgi:hypothetical protein
MSFSQISKRFVQLSFQDKYILSFERDDFPFNSHLVVEFKNEIDFEKLKKTFKDYLKAEDFLRLKPHFDRGDFEIQEYNEEKASSSFDFVSSVAEFENARNRKFNFEIEYAVRITVFLNDKKILLSFHHSMFDGHAQFNFLKDFLDIYSQNGHYKPRSLNDVYKFRKYFKTLNFSWIKGLLIETFNYTFKKEKKEIRKKIARLYDHEPKSRLVDYKIINLERSIVDKGVRKFALSSSAYIALLMAKALDKTLRDRGDLDSPIVLYIPKSMRFEFKVMRHFQNLLGFIWLKINRENIDSAEFEKQFRDTYKFRSKEDEVKKTLLLAAIFVKFKKYIDLKKGLTKKETKIHDCSLIISSGRTPSDIVFPEEWGVDRPYAVGSMTRSPGIGVLSTSYGSRDFVTVEYLRDAFDVKTIEIFCENFLALASEKF